MKAVILAGGAGKRLRSIVHDRPKPMATIATKPFLEFQISLLKKYNITDIILCVGYLYDHIINYFKNGYNWNVNIHYSIEEHALGTAGAIKNAARYLNDPFLVLNGDTFYELDISNFIHFHKQKSVTDTNYFGIIALTKVKELAEYGVVKVDSNDRIKSFYEKPLEESSDNYINAGIYLLDPKILNIIAATNKVSIEKETFPSALKSGYSIFGFRSEGFFVDIGTHNQVY